MMGRPGNRDARCFWQANLDEAIGRLVFLVRTYQPDVMTTYNDFGGYGHPDHIRTHLVAVGAFARAGDPAWYPEQLAPEHGGTGAPADEGGLAPWTPAKLYEQAIPASVRTAMVERLEAIGERSFWSPPEDATPEQLEEFNAFLARMLVPDETITAWVDVHQVLDQRWDAIKAHRTQISDDNPFVRFGKEAWAEYWHREAFVRRETRVPAPEHETDLFEGLDGRTPGRVRLGRRDRAGTRGRRAVANGRPRHGNRDAYPAIAPQNQSLKTPTSLPALWTTSPVTMSMTTTPITPDPFEERPVTATYGWPSRTKNRSGPMSRR